MQQSLRFRLPPQVLISESPVADRPSHGVDRQPEKSWPSIPVARLHDCTTARTTERPNGRMAEWPNGQIAESPNRRPHGRGKHRPLASAAMRVRGVNVAVDRRRAALPMCRGGEWDRISGQTQEPVFGHADALAEISNRSDASSISLRKVGRIGASFASVGAAHGCRGRTRREPVPGGSSTTSMSWKVLPRHPRTPLHRWPVWRNEGRCFRTAHAPAGSGGRQANCQDVGARC